MPELPEVEYFMQYIRSTSLHQKIKAVHVKSAQMLLEVTVEEFERLLNAKEFFGCQRHGKYLFTEVQSDLWLVLHFGMTGNLKYFKATENEPPYTRLLFSFVNGFSLALTDQRKFGKISVTKGPWEFVRQKNLGPDALQLDFPSFKALVAKSSGAIKGALLDQHRIAGLGNIYADEILFQTCIHPCAKTCELDEQTVRQLFRNMKRILKTAIKHNADIADFPRNWLLHNRVKGRKCPKCPGRIVTLKVAGRTAYFCPSCQKMPQSRRII